MAYKMITPVRVRRGAVLSAFLALSVSVFIFRDRWTHGEQPPVTLSASTPGFTNEASNAGPSIVTAARSQIGKTVKYDPKYVSIGYPMGDVPVDRGTCTDVVIRALRDALGMDLQQLVHEDMKSSFLLYPKRWGLKLPDKNIDHRRVLTLMKYFERKGFAIPVSDKPEDYLPGDIVTTGLPHILIVSDRKTDQGIPLAIHNIGRGTQEEDALSSSVVTGHYRIEHHRK